MLLLGFGSITISFKDFLFTTRYYKTPLKAYNAGSGYDAILGDTSADKEMGLCQLDDTTALFLGEIRQNLFVVDEMQSKNGKYASKGLSIFYDLEEESDGPNKNTTRTESQTVSWSILYTRAEVENAVDVKRVETYTHSGGQKIYLVVFN